MWYRINQHPNLVFFERKKPWSADKAVDDNTDVYTANEGTCIKIVNKYDKKQILYLRIF